MAKIKAGIIGAAGYTGGELIRILIHHPAVELVFAKSDSQAGKPISSVHSDLVGDTDLLFSDSLSNDIDVLFLCVGHGQAKKFVLEDTIPAHIRIIDLSQDFRLGETIGDREFVYGLPEFQKEAIKSAQNIANPGCFATAIQLGLLPLASAGLLKNTIHTTGITGSTGAGQSLSETSHFSWRQNNLSVYKVFQHQHLNEINRTLGQAQGSNPEILFVPYRGPFTRGIWITSYLETKLSEADAIALYQEFYANHPCTHMVNQPLDLKQVVNTNKCLIQLEKQGNHLLIYSIIDNLTKGASGQAVQNLNLMFGLDETAGLHLKPLAF
jgi:N-acetyl-gamma-glutamyl-phosphate reductase